MLVLDFGGLWLFHYPTLFVIQFLFGMKLMFQEILPDLLVSHLVKVQQSITQSTWKITTVESLLRPQRLDELIQCHLSTVEEKKRTGKLVEQLVEISANKQTTSVQHLKMSNCSNTAIKTQTNSAE